MPDPNLRLLENAVGKLAAFLDEIVFVGGVTLGLLITDEAAAPIRGTTDVDVIAEIVTYADYIAFSERLRQAHFIEDTDLTCRWHNGTLNLDGRVMAREIGSLLLGANASCRTGIMKAHWTSNDLNVLAGNEMYFTAEQARQMDTRLVQEARTRQAETQNKVAANDR